MLGNRTFHLSNTSVLSVEAEDAPRIVTSAQFDEQLHGTYERLGLRPGMLDGLVGIRERRWWDDGVTHVEGAAMAGAKAIAESGIDSADIGLMVNTSVSRAHLEPSTAVAVHHALGLADHCQNFDVSNACLGFVNGMQIAAAMIESGQVEYALIVNGEDARAVQEATLARLVGPETTVATLMDEFATLTLGSGAVAMVLGPADRHPEGHRLLGGASRAGTEHHQLCVGDLDMMRTDARGLLAAGITLSRALWVEAAGEFDWASGMDRYIIHQVSQVHTGAVCEALGVDKSKVPLTFPTYGNIGPASVPFTLAKEKQDLQLGDRVLLMGIGSGLNASCTEIAW
ncbi:MAG: 3-oxoacyl-[ACP] synthase III in alkane synthesis cluster [uncultured Nocardioidaceae bacterium]|uniref:3-oxoacyl-[ACP] synthase III in alkane synthesis cluster n=1 Tax=uncultured Nocardioidaceae bacterium TaxID=253824 RepID=A0A6J4LN06_9ACTN|nr:MAG: 3-oxoacyl-[ACP] synthase III in alkane synthesis cluster [uncultured Nocardioidaceae bacterium]